MHDQQALGHVLVLVDAAEHEARAAGGSCRPWRSTKARTAAAAPGAVMVTHAAIAACRDMSS